jgi:Tfp pilus assembly protein PilN
MTTQPAQQSAAAVTVARVEWAPVPRVNLLPEEILAARGFRKVQFRLVLAVVTTILLASGGVFWAQRQVSSARADLEATTARSTALQQEETRYAEVPRLTAAVASAKALREQALSQDMLWYRLMSDVALATPSNVWLTTMNVNLNTTTGATAGSAGSGGPAGSGAAAGSAGSAGAAGPAGAAAGSDPLLPAGIGRMIVTGTAVNYPDVAAWLDSIARVHGLDGSTLRTVTRENASGKGEQLTFTTEIVIVATALSHRYDQKAG